MVVCVIVVKIVIVVSIVYCSIWIVEEIVEVVGCCVGNWGIGEWDEVFVLIDGMGFVRWGSGKGRLMFFFFDDGVGCISFCGS